MKKDLAEIMKLVRKQKTLEERHAEILELNEKERLNMIIAVDCVEIFFMLAEKGFDEDKLTSFLMLIEDAVKHYWGEGAFAFLDADSDSITFYGSDGRSKEIKRGDVSRDFENELNILELQ